MKFFLPLLLSACLSVFPEKDLVDNPNDDFDGDGLTEVDGDCDDDNAGVGKIIWYVDGDGDGFGLDSLQTESCIRPEGYAEQIGDCDDDDSDINPEAIEICDSKDNDCDLLIDDDDSEWLKSTGTYFYNDLDGDGYGTPGFNEVACGEIPGMVSNSDDCDDENYLINQDAAELCDGIDNDCDRLIDSEDDSLSEESSTPYYLDSDQDGYGDPNQIQKSCELPNGYVENALDCNDENPSITQPLWYLDADGDGDGNP